MPCPQAMCHSELAGEEFRLTRLTTTHDEIPRALGMTRFLCHAEYADTLTVSF